MTEKKQPSIDWGRIHFLPHNHYFKEAVKKTRKSLGLREDGIAEGSEAMKWLHKHLGLPTPFLPNVNYIPLWIVLMPSSYEGNEDN